MQPVCVCLEVLHNLKKNNVSSKCQHNYSIYTIFTDNVFNMFLLYIQYTLVTKGSLEHFVEIRENIVVVKKFK